MWLENCTCFYDSTWNRGMPLWSQSEKLCLLPFIMLGAVPPGEGFPAPIQCCGHLSIPLGTVQPLLIPFSPLDIFHH